MTTKIRAALLLCARCRWYSSYRATKGGVKHIDTICRVCGSRLRYTHRGQPFTLFQGVKLRWGSKGSGAHNRSRSVLDCVPCEPKKVHKMAAERNRLKQIAIAKRDGVEIKYDDGFDDEEVI